MEIPEFETVEQFRDWWMKIGCPIRPPFKDAVFAIDTAFSLCIFRHKQFQIELYICKPNTFSQSHSHPGVDSAFVYLTGNLQFARGDNPVVDISEHQVPRADGCHKLLGVSPMGLVAGGFHSLQVKEEGGAFLSFEKWNEKEPTSVTVNWAGPTVGELHNELITERKES
jgi:hypothetical protein